MAQELIDRIATLLRQDGFKRVTRQRSSVSQTLAAERDETSVVIHISEGGAAPTSLAVPHSTAPKGLEIMIKATLPGLRASAPDLRAGQGTEALRALRRGAGGASDQRPANSIGDQHRRSGD